jgi:hypothetical protein
VWIPSAKATLPHSLTPLESLQPRRRRRRDLYSQLPSHYLFCPFAVERLFTFSERKPYKLVRELELIWIWRASSGDARETA